MAGPPLYRRGGGAGGLLAGPPLYRGRGAGGLVAGPPLHRGKRHSRGWWWWWRAQRPAFPLTRDALSTHLLPARRPQSFTVFIQQIC